MTKQEAKQWAELFTAIAEGKTIQSLDTISGRWEDVRITVCDYLEGLPSDYRIKPTPKTRRMTDQELADWLRDCPEEHREYRAKYSSSIWWEYAYDEGNGNVPCGDVFIRRNHGEWEEPLVEEE